MKAGEGSDAKTGSETQPVREGPMNHREANKLDILMQIMFDHIYRTSHKEGKNSSVFTVISIISNR